MSYLSKTRNLPCAVTDTEALSSIDHMEVSVCDFG